MNKLLSLTVVAGLAFGLLAPQVFAQTAGSYNASLGKFCANAKSIATLPRATYDPQLSSLLHDATGLCSFDLYKPWPPRPDCVAGLTVVPAFCKGDSDNPCAWHCVDLRDSASYPSSAWSHWPKAKVKVSSVTKPKPAAPRPVASASSSSSASAQPMQTSSSAYYVPNCAQGQHLDVVSCITGGPSSCRCIPDQVVSSAAASSVSGSACPTGQHMVSSCPSTGYGPCQSVCSL